MKEDFLHFIWKHQLIKSPFFISETNEKIEIVTPGEHNHNQGPDFSTSVVKINGQTWVGNIEIHNNSKDWFLHKHQFDNNYNNVILHVIWDHFIPIINAEGRVIPTIRLLPYTKDTTKNNLKTLIKQNSIIPCERLIHKASKTAREEEVSKNYQLRLKRKTNEIGYDKLQHSLKDVLSILLFQAFGGNINKEPFRLLAQTLPIKTLLKYRNNIQQIEALLFGAGAFLESSSKSEYYNSLQREWRFLKQKHNLNSCTHCNWKFSRLRPYNFPTFKIAQLASIIVDFENIFKTIKTYGKIARNYEATTNEFWKNHFNFEKESKPHNTKFSKKTIDSININASHLFLYLKSNKNFEKVVELSKNTPPENNRITKKFVKLGFPNNNAFQSQGLKELYSQKCSNKKCLNCLIGSNALSNIK